MKLFTIGKISKICNIPIKTLRYYDEIGLLAPDKISSENNYRYYSKKTIMQVAMIKYLKMLGFKLENIKKIIKRSNNTVLEEQLLDQLDIIELEIENLRRKKNAIEEWNDLLKINKYYIANPQETEVQKIKIAAFDCVHLKYEVEQYYEYSEVLYSISNTFTLYCSQNGLLTHGAFWVRFPNTKKRLGNKIREIEFFSAVEESQNNNIETEVIGDIEALVSIHIGGYDSIEKTYQKIICFSEKHKLQLAGYAFEKYIIDAWSSLHQEGYVTEIIMPLQEKQS